MTHSNSVQILTRKGAVILCDHDDAVRFRAMTWHVTSKGYAATSLKTESGFKCVFMHRLVLTPPDGQVIDHINGNKLDNRRANLRCLTNQENCHAARKRQVNNRTGVRGVSVLRGKFQAGIGVNGRSIYLGLFDSIEEAAEARARAESTLTATSRTPKVCR